MKRASDEKGEEQESHNSPKRFVTLNNITRNYSPSFRLSEEFSTTGASSKASKIEFSKDETTSVLIRDETPFYDPTEVNRCYGLVMSEGQLSTTGESNPAEVLVQPEHIPLRAKGDVLDAKTIFKTKETNLQMSALREVNAPTSNLTLKPNQDKKTIIVRKPNKPNIYGLSKLVEPIQKSSGPECCIIQNLIINQFTQGSWTEQEKIVIISNGPPQPIINPKCISTPDYQSRPWLAGCLDKSTMYCWYCLLFSTTKIWSISACHRVSVLRDANKHNATTGHAEAEILWKHWKSKIDRGHTTKINDTEIDVSIQNDHGTSYDFEKCLIAVLLSNSFVLGSWTEKDRDNIIRRGRPMPKMESLVVCTTGKPPIARQFSESEYKSVPWLTGSEKFNKLFCWPCVLFCPQGSWGKYGFVNMHLLSLSTHRHQLSHQHLDACLRLKMWEQLVKKLSDEQKVPNEKHNEAVKRNRDFMKYIIDVMCYIKKKTDNAEVSYEDSMKLIRKISHHDVKLKHYLRTRSFSIEEITGITQSIQAILMQKITKEANCANFVSVILNAVRNKPLISISLRLVKDNGEINERFLQFIEFKYGRSINELLEKVLEAIGFISNTKLVGFTHDDYGIKAMDLSYFNSRITEKFPSANFFHYGEHNLKSLLMNSLSHKHHCRCFIRGILDLTSFFEQNQIAKISLTVIDHEITGEGENRDHVWDFTSGMIKTINDHYPAFMELFERTIRSAVAWNTETVAEAHNFINFLHSLENRFLIATFSRIFDEIDELTTVMEEEFNVVKWKQTAEKTNEAVIKARCEDFEVIFQSAWNMLPSDQEYAYDFAYAEKFDEIMESTSLFIHCRTKDVERWSFMELVTYPLLDASMTPTEWNKHITFLKRQFPEAGFDRLLVQLTFFKTNALFKGKTVDELIRYIYDLGMTSALPALHKFSQLLLTLPLYPIHTKKTPVISRIASYTDEKNYNFTSGDAQMNVEKDFLIELQQEPDFEDDVITHFADNFGGAHLKFKKVT